MNVEITDAQIRLAIFKWLDAYKDAYTDYPSNEAIARDLITAPQFCLLTVAEVTRYVSEWQEL